MKYNFDQVTDRKNTASKKFDAMQEVFGTSDALPLWIADMDFPAAEPILKALEQRVRHGIFGYDHRPDAYYKAFANWQKKRNGWAVDPSMMSFSPGVVNSVIALINQYTDPGDKVLVQTPSYPPFLLVAPDFDRELVLSELLTDETGDYRMNLEDFEAKASKGDIKIFILVNPHNPTGRTWSREELLSVGKLCLKYNIRIIADEIHSDIILKDGRHIPMMTLSEEISAITTTCLSPTKTFNLAGLQTSVIVFSNKEDKMRYDDSIFKNHTILSNAFAGSATEAAFEEGEEWMIQMKDYVYDNILYVHEFLRKHIPSVKSYIPQGTYLMWLDMRGLGFQEHKDLMHFLLYKAKIALNSGDAFGKNGEGFARLNCATSRSVLEQAMKQLKEAVDLL